MTRNIMFPIEISNMKKRALISTTNESSIWHLRYGHLNVNGLRLLKQKNMVFGLPKINSFDFCEGCVYRKQSRIISLGWK